MPPDTERDAPARLLMVVAAPSEARAVAAALGSTTAGDSWSVAELGPTADLLATGVGKSNAAGAVARFAVAGRYRAVVNLGIAGALPGSGLALASRVIARRSVFADEGVVVPGGFLALADLGFPPSASGRDFEPADPGLFELLRTLADAEGAIATVSMCSGTDGRAAEIAARTGAIAEAMEGAAVLASAFRAGLPAVELRVISNTTGDRDRQAWDLRGSLEALGRLARGVVNLVGASAR